MLLMIPTGANAESFVAPKFLSVEFTQKTFDAGDPIELTVYSEVGTNPIDYVWVQIEHKETKRLFYSQNIPYTDNGTDVAITLPVAAPPGDYVIQAISILDTAGVRTDTFYPGGLNATFQLIGEPVDTDKPIYHQASFDKAQYQPGDEIVLTVDATDDQSGMEFVYASIIHGISQEYRLWGFSSEINGKHEIRISLPDNSLSGEYKIQYLTLRDNAGNETNVFNPGITFEVVGGITDIAAPTLKNISIEKTEYKAGETVHIEIDAEDESGVESVYLYVRHIGTGVQYNAFATFNGTTFDFKRPLPIDAPTGTYEVFAIYLEDTFGNQTNLFRYEPRIQFDVIE